MSLDGRVGLVTGAQQGIGRAIAAAMGQAGASVVINWLDDEEAAREVAAAIREIGADAVTVQGDVAVRSDCERMFAAGAELGGVDLLVNNAGVFPRIPLLDITDDAWNRVQEVNVVGGMRCMQLLGRELAAQEQSGAVVNIASGAFFGPPREAAHYSASKGAVIGMTRAAAVELAQYRIRVNAIAPGIVDTAQPRGGLTEEQIGHISDRVPLGAMAQPADVASVAVFLCSDAAGHITGQTLQVNGGTRFS